MNARKRWGLFPCNSEEQPRMPGKRADESNHQRSSSSLDPWESADGGRQARPEEDAPASLEQPHNWDHSACSNEKRPLEVTAATVAGHDTPLLHLPNAPMSGEQESRSSFPRGRSRGTKTCLFGPIRPGTQVVLHFGHRLHDEDADAALAYPVGVVLTSVEAPTRYWVELGDATMLVDAGEICSLDDVVGLCIV